MREFLVCCSYCSLPQTGPSCNDTWRGKYGEGSMEWIWVWNLPFPFFIWMVLEATLGCHFPTLLQVLIKLSDKCPAKLQSTYLTLSNNEHDGLEVKNSKSVPGSSPILQNPRDEPGCPSSIIWNKEGGTWTVCWQLRSSAHLAPFTP